GHRSRHALKSVSIADRLIATDPFAAAVTEKLDAIDLETKRKIVLGLVKRVEIHKDEIVVVFRVDPQPPVRGSENSTDSDAGEKSMQHCRRRNFTVAQ
ncbi:hypothetical protein ACLKMY_39795, partial [Paraburkholderia mimosarum]